MVEIRRLEAADRQKRSQEEADARERIQVIGKRIGAGDYNVSDTSSRRRPPTRRSTASRGPAFDLAIGRTSATSFARPAIGRRAMARRDQRAGGQGRQADDGRGRSAQASAGVGGPAIERFNADPYAAAADRRQSGAGASIRAIRSSRCRRASLGRAPCPGNGLQNVPYLNNDELKAMRDRVGQGAAGELEVAADLRRTFGVGVGTDVAKQSIGATRTCSSMSASSRKRRRSSARASTRSRPIPSCSPAARATPIAPARSSRICAGDPAGAPRADRRGGEEHHGGRRRAVHRASLEGDEFEATYRNAIQRAAGQVGTGQRSHRRLRQLERPPRVASADDGADASFSSASRGRAPENWKQAAGGAPYYQGPNGKLTPLSDDQLKQLGRYTLESVSPGIYQPVGPTAGTSSTSTAGRGASTCGSWR
jgi:hypothetical protein